MRYYVILNNILLYVDEIVCVEEIKQGKFYYCVFIMKHTSAIKIPIRMNNYIDALKEIEL